MPLYPAYLIGLALLALVASTAAEPAPTQGSHTAPSHGPHIYTSATTPFTMPTDSMRVDLSIHEWEHRLLVVFAPSLGAESWAVQREKWLGFGDGFEDRDLRLYVVGGEAAGRFYTAPHGQSKPITAESAQALRDRFNVTTKDYVVVLVGKDGTEKRRDSAPVHADAIFATIDAMPMRRAEMRKDG